MPRMRVFNFSSDFLWASWASISKQRAFGKKFRAISDQRPSEAPTSMIVRI